MLCLGEEEGPQVVGEIHEPHRLSIDPFQLVLSDKFEISPLVSFLKQQRVTFGSETAKNINGVPS